MEYIWSLFAFFAGYVVFELYEFNNRFKLHEHNFNELQSQGTILKNENEVLRLEINRLQHQLELYKVKIGILNTDIRNRDDFLKDIDKGARLFHEELKNTVKQMDKLVEHVATMDKQIEDMSREFKFVHSEINILHRATNLNRDHRGMRSDYMGGSVVLNTIKSGVNFIITKLVEYIAVGLTSVLLLQ